MLRLTVRPYMQRLASRLASTKNPELGSHQSLDKGIASARIQLRRLHRRIDTVSTARVMSLSLHWPMRRASLPMSDSAARKDDLIQIRASAATKAILNRAAAMRGQKLSEFMLESARARAEETILDQRLFALDDNAYNEFLAMLDAPVKPDKALRARMKRKPAWER